MERKRRLEHRSYSYDYLLPGDWFATPELVVEASHIDRFAELSGDFFEIHMSDAAAQKFGGLAPFTSAEVATLVGAAFLGSEAVLLLGFESEEIPVRQALRRFGQLIRRVEGKDASGE